MKGSVLALALAAVLTIGLTQAANGDAQYTWSVNFQSPSTIVYSVYGQPSGSQVIPVDGSSSGCVALSGDPTDISPDADGDGSNQVTINAACNPAGGPGSVTIRIFDPTHAKELYRATLNFTVVWVGPNSTITLVNQQHWTVDDFQQVPATGTIGLIVLLCLIGGAGLWFVRRKRAAVA